MKLEPVFLVAPRPQPPAMPTRRAFLLAGCTFAIGSTIGGACGYSIGIAKGDAGKGTAESGAAGAEDKLESTGNARLDYWRNLAVKGSLDELLEKAVEFLSVQMMDYKQDPVLWVGVDRITREVIDNPKRSINYRVIGVAIENIRYLQSPPELKLTDRLPVLTKRREEERKRQR